MVEVLSSVLHWFRLSLQIVTHQDPADLSAFLAHLNLSQPILMAPQVSDEMRVRIILWHD